MPAKAKMDNNGNITITCECGKPIIKSNKYGMFCEDECGLKESKKAKFKLNSLIKTMGDLFNV